MKIKGILINGKEGEIEDDTGEYIQLRDVTATSKSVDYLAGSTEAVDLGKLGHGGIDGGSNNYLGNASHADVLKSNSNLLSSNDELNGSRLSLNSNLSIDNLAATRGDFPAILPYHPLDQALLPKLKFDYNAKSNQKKICGCVPFWVPYLFVGLAFAGVVVYFAVSVKPKHFVI